MRVMVVGSGGREHALAWKLSACPAVDAIVCAPGNAGTALIGSNLDVSALGLDGLAQAAREHRIDLTIVGPEAPLAAGLVDRFEKDNLRVFGPSSGAAQIEASKVWAKELLLRFGIPTGHAEVVEAIGPARAAIARSGFPAVIKADGLAGGKGVWVAADEHEAEEALAALFEARSLGAAGARALIEQHLVGRELSVMAFADGDRLAVMPPARDYKRLGDGDTGPNTGGMGAYTRPADATTSLLEQVEREILRPTLAAMVREGRPFRGVLYAGLMLTRDGPKVLEFNCRFGDPECEVILPLMESDLLETCQAVAEGCLDPDSVRWASGAACGVVLAADGYPASPHLGDVVAGLDDLGPDVLAFHGGTALNAGAGAAGTPPRVVTAGGRVVTLAAAAPSLAAARDRVYASVPKVTFAGKQLRTDIGLDGTPDVRAHRSPGADAARPEVSAL